MSFLKEVHLLRSSQENVRTICYNVAIIRIIVELQQKLNMCNETFSAEDLTR